MLTMLQGKGFIMDTKKVPAIPLPEGTPLTGAGDALCAGLISGISKGLSAAGCAREGVRCADLRLRRADAFL